MAAPQPHAQESHISALDEHDPGPHGELDLDLVRELVQEMEPGFISDADIESLAEPARTLPHQVLDAKGSCWYCDEPLDNVRRFCGRECTAAFIEETGFAPNSNPSAPN
jgi:hypothetical protein